MRLSTLASASRVMTPFMIRRSLATSTPSSGCVLTMRTSAPSSSFTATMSLSTLQCSVRCFDLKQHELERRRRRELEKAGIDPDDDTPWIAPEEEQRIAEEDERRKAEQDLLVKAMLEKRAAEDAEKKLKFKEFRAKQVAMSRQRKEESAANKEAKKNNSREIVEDVVEDPDNVPAKP
jgi:hypothetical protein